MDAVQRMRAKAKGAGKLKSNEQMKVETQGGRGQDRRRDRAGQPAGRLRAELQPDRRVRRGGVSVSVPGVLTRRCYSRRARRSRSAWASRWAPPSTAAGATGAGGAAAATQHQRQPQQHVRERANRAGGQPAGPSQWQHNPQHRGGAPYGNRRHGERFGGYDARRSAARSGRPAARRGGRARRRQARRRGSGGSARQQAGGAGGPQPAAAPRGGAGGGERVGNRSVPSSGGGQGRRRFRRRLGRIQRQQRRARAARGAVPAWAVGAGRWWWRWRRWTEVRKP